MRDDRPEVWMEVLAYLKVHHSNLVRSWFDELQVGDVEAGQVQVRPRNQAQERYLRLHCNTALHEAVQSVTGRLLAVDIENGADDASGCGQSTVSPFHDETLLLSEDNLFEHFVTGPCNRLAHAASVAVCSDPGNVYNPLFIHGPSGLGKTHLAQAICHAMVSRSEPCQIAYLSCETFINHFIEAVERRLLHEFRNRYRQADILVIDDIQFLADREGSQEEFFHTFNQLYQSHKQIVLTSDRPPTEIPTLEDRLVSRFNWGLVAFITRPCFETRTAILRKKAKLRNVTIPEEVISYLASTIDSNTRELEGAITKLQGMSMLSGGDITLEMAREAVGEPVERSSVSIQDILSALTKRFNVRISDIQSRRRSKSIAFPRQVGMYLARELTRHSLGEIGGFFGGRDHTTVLHATRTISQQRQNDPQVESILNDLMKSLHQD